MRARLLSVHVGLRGEIGTRRGRPVRSCDVAEKHHFAPERAAELLELEKLGGSFRAWAAEHQAGQR